MRPRPFEADPVGAPIVDGVTHVRGASFPSGHASLAFAAAAVLGALEPARAAALEQEAAQVSFGRVYAAAHFPTDVQAGVYIGAATAEWALRHQPAA